ncbi:hypothetical protein [Acinetobacter sp. UBA2581]|uniref:hypothetical protein n=1 Tax=Acinetobacter sp. UBA2581 TaxID=1945932 RepID=UPI00257DE715|nr:hypothetical protein [Acinetobacter sp. UBA2581]
MPEWLDFRLTKIDYAFREFPKLKYLSLLYAALIIFSAIFYIPILKLAHSFNYFGSYPLQGFISENISWLFLGQFVVPVVLVLFSYFDVSGRHDEMYLKKYRQLPKWVR